MANVYDAIVIGGGHNGLTAGAYFARAGARTVVLESRDKTGGAADTSAPFPDHPEIKVTTYSYVMSLMPPTIINELNLKRHGYDVTPFGPYYQAFPDGTSITVYADDASKSYESIARISRKDAETLPKWEAWMQDVADVMGPLLLQKPPKVGSMAFGDLIESVRAAWKMRKLGVRGVGDVTRLFTMSVTDLVDDWFESDAMKGMLAVNGVIGTWAGPDEPGTAYVMLHHSIGDVGDGHLGSWGYQQGGMGAVSDSIRRSAESFGCEVRTDARVQRVLVRNGRFVGVVLENGDELRAPIGVTCIHPKIAFLDLVGREELPADFVWDIERWRTRSGVVKINVAMSELPDFIADPGKEQQEHHTGSVELCFSTRYAEEAFQDAHMGRKAAERPFVDGVIPTTLDKQLAPEGVHVFSMFSQWVPDDWNLEPHRDELEAYADRIIDLYTELAPNFKSAIIDRQILGPYDMEQELGLIGGNIFHGELSVDQLFHMRPAPGYADYRTPIRGLYHGSSATHAGGGVNGIPGWQAYRAAARDRAIKEDAVTSAEADASSSADRGALQRMLEATSVAVVGASVREGSVGHQSLVELVEGGFEGRIVPVNPKYESILGLPAVGSLSDIGEPVDLVILAVSNALLEEQLRAAASIGAGSAVIFASGYEEPREGAPPLTERLSAIAREAGMAVCGGNCMGFVNLERRVRALGFYEPKDAPVGGITFLSHSGSAFSAMIHNDRLLGLNLAVSAGQEFVTTVADYLHYALGLDSTKAIGLFIETIRDPEGFRSALEVASSRDVPVMALKVGRETFTRELVAAHSGALAGEDGAYEALFDACGVSRVESLDEMADTLALFVAGRRAGPGGLASVHDSGGERALLVDAAAAVGVPFAKISADTSKRIEALLDPGLPPVNPLDFWGTGRDAHEIVTGCVRALLEDEAVAALAFSVDLTTEEHDALGYVAMARETFPETVKPFAMLSNFAGGIDRTDAKVLHDDGIAVLEGTLTGLAAFRHLFAYRDHRALAPVAHTSRVDGAIRDRWRARLSSGEDLDELDGLELLATYGVPVAHAERASTLEEARSAAERIGYPIALKTAEPNIHHKSDVDGVKLSLVDGTAVGSAYDDLSKRLGPDVLIAAMAPPGVEVHLGIVRDLQFGPLVLVAAGGVLVEVLRDRRLAVPPLDEERARWLLDGLRIRPLLEGVRGAPPADVDALIGAIVGVSWLAHDLGDRLEALDANPVICGPVGAVAVDALVIPGR